MPTTFTYHNLCPCVDLYYGPAPSILAICVRRWTANGRERTEDGTYLWDRADKLFALPVEAEPLGQAVKSMLDASRQLGKRIPTLATPVREAVHMPDRDQFDQAFYPVVVWTHRDAITPYVIAVPTSPRVHFMPVYVPKDASSQLLGSHLLDILQRIKQLNWD